MGGLKGGARTHHIDDRVDCTDLVQLNIGRVDAVDGALNVGERCIDSCCTVADALGEACMIDHRQHIAGRPMRSM
jgi:hypothetical protein